MNFKLTEEQRRLVNVKMGQDRRARLKAADGKWNISDLSAKESNLVVETLELAYQVQTPTAI